MRLARAAMHVGIANPLWRGKTFPAFLAHAQPVILRIWQEAQVDTLELSIIVNSSLISSIKSANIDLFPVSCQQLIIGLGWSILVKEIHSCRVSFIHLHPKTGDVFCCIDSNKYTGTLCQNDVIAPSASQLR